ncbi:hypothetical protein ABLT31_22460 [Ammoniphilus sp. 3BR4]
MGLFDWFKSKPNPSPKTVKPTSSQRETAQREKSVKPKPDLSLEATEKRVTDLNKWFDQFYIMGLKANECYEKGEVKKAKTTLEKAIFQLDSDIPSHYHMLTNIYDQLRDQAGLEKLKQKAIQEITRDRNVQNGSNIKFERISKEIDFILRLDQLAKEVQGFVLDTPGMNQAALIRWITQSFQLEYQKPKRVYEHTLQLGYIRKEKQGKVYQHFAVEETL